MDLLVPPSWPFACFSNDESSIIGHNLHFQKSQGLLRKSNNQSSLLLRKTTKYVT
jgi:hypothetical protein